jgi:hypothetical protein
LRRAAIRHEAVERLLVLRLALSALEFLEGLGLFVELPQRRLTALLEGGVLRRGPAALPGPAALRRSRKTFAAEAAAAIAPDAPPQQKRERRDAERLEDPERDDDAEDLERQRRPELAPGMRACKPMRLIDVPVWCPPPRFRPQRLTDLALQ